MNYAIKVYTEGFTGLRCEGYYNGKYRVNGETYVAFGNKDRDDIKFYKNKKVCENAIKKSKEQFFTIEFKVFENKLEG